MGALAPEGHVKATSSTRLVTTSTNLTVVKVGPLHLYSVVICNPTAAPGFLKLYDKATAPAPASDHPVLVFPLTVSATGVFYFGEAGIVFSSGLSYATTLNLAESDNTNCAAVTDTKIVLTFSAPPVVI